MQLGYQIIAASADRPEKLNESIEKNGLKYEVVSDGSQEAAAAFGLAFRVDDETLKRYKGFGIDLNQASGFDHNVLPVPGIFLIGKDGVIDFSYVNPDYRVRLESSVVLAAAKVHAAEPE